MKTFKQYLIKESFNKKDQKYFIDEATKLKNEFEKCYDSAELLCRELDYEGTLQDEANKLLDEIEPLQSRIVSKIDKMISLIKKS